MNEWQETHILKKDKANRNFCLYQFTNLLPEILTRLERL